MKVGVMMSPLYFAGLHHHSYVTVAKKAEDLGFESIWLGDHLIIPGLVPATYPGSPDGNSPFHHARMQRMDPLVTFSHLAAVTHRLRLETNVYLLPLRPPFVTARAVTTLDLLSDGRFLFGVGVGWMQTEYETLGEDFHTRGRRTDEVLDILKRLWTQDSVEYHGRFYTFGPVHFEPKPVQRPHPPLLIGGVSDPALKRAARWGDGWISDLNRATGRVYSPPEVREFITILKALRDEAGRGHEPIAVTVTSLQRLTTDDVLRLHEAGAERVTVVPWPEPNGPLTEKHMLAGMEDYVETVLARVQA